MLRKRSGKRKLSYSDRKVTKKQDGLLYTVQHDGSVTQKKHPDDWQRGMEGFEGFNVDNGKSENPSKRRRSFTFDSNPKQPEQGGTKDDAIAWSSSEEEGLWTSEEEIEQKDFQKKSRKIIKSNQQNMNRTKQSGSSQLTCHVAISDIDVDIHESDSESVSGFVTSASKSEQDSQSESKSSQIIESGILDYESEGSRMGLSQTDVLTIPAVTDSPLEVNDTSPEISGSRSSDIDGSQDSRSKVRASDWVKSLNLKTPTKDESNNEIPDMEDSAKKKKKFKRGGFADQMSRIQQRERSAIRIWTHQQTVSDQAAPSQESSRVITVLVMKHQLLYSLQLTTCDVLSGQPTRESLLVLFSQELTEQYNIQDGSVVKIYPPWQQLDLRHSKQRIVLCTNFCRVMNPCKTRTEVHGGLLGGDCQVTKRCSDTVTARGRWNCSCVTGLVYDHRSCPAFKSPSLPGLLCQEWSMDSNSDPSSSSTASDPGLQLIEATQQVPSQTKVKAIVKDTLLDNIHDQGIESHSISFTGLVHRVLKKEDVKGLRWTLLVEDRQGTVCKIVLQDMREKRNDAMSYHEGKTYNFSGLVVHCRTNRHRSPDLFSMIDTVWSGNVIVISSQDSQEKQVGLKTNSAYPPGFCYVLSQKESDSSSTLIKEATFSVSKYEMPKISDLFTVVSKDSSDSSVYQRITFIGTVVTLTSSSYESLLATQLRTSDGDEDIILFVTDRILNCSKSCKNYVTIKMKQSHVSRSLEECQGQSGRNVFLFRDVLHNVDGLLCDQYSTMLLVNNINKELLSSINDLKTVLKVTSDLQPSIPCLTPETRYHSLCSVAGKITAVDENSAYSWEVCDVCGQDKLATKVGSEDVICLACKREVQKPAMKLKMEIYVDLVPHVDKARIKVNLLQRTVEDLLPEEEFEEGHELESVLGRNVGPLNCIVQNITDEKSRNREFFLQELQILT